MNKIEYSKQAQKFLLSQATDVSLRICERIALLPKGDVKKLEGTETPPLYRLRVGKIRVVYYRDADNIKIVKIDFRGDVYK